MPPGGVVDLSRPAPSHGLSDQPFRGGKGLALGVAAIAVVASAATIGLVVANRHTISSLDAADPVAMVMPVTFAAVGALVAARHPRNPTGWLFLFIALVEGLAGASDQYARFALITHPGSLPGAQWVLWFGSLLPGTVWPVGSAAALLMLLPNGHLPSRRWRPVQAVNLGAAVFFTVVLGAMGTGSLTVTDTSRPALTNPTAVPGIVSIAGASIGTAIYLLALLVVVVAAAAPLIRIRRASNDEKQQLKWIAYAVLLSAIVSFALTLLALVVPSWQNTLGVMSTIAIVVGFGVALPVASGVAILKYRLYDIDIVISRTLVYGSLALFITAVYVGIAVGLGALIGGGGKPNLALSVLATAIVAVGFQPARQRVQHVANRLVYGKRATPYEVLSQFSERVAESYAAEDVLPRMARVLAEGTGSQRAGVWLCSAHVWYETAAWPAGLALADPVPADDGALPPRGDSERIVEVRHQGQLLGALAVTKRAGETLTPVENNLLNHLAGQAGIVLRNIGLTADLRSRLDELRASRQRLVTAQDEERRRLERNLHDGAQQHLVALKVKLGLAEMFLVRDPDRARSTLQQLTGDADEALETLRDLARGIYPPLLADKGLKVALESQARKATVPVTVLADGIDRYSQDIEAAVYFCTLEALQNIQKYAHANRVTVRLEVDHDLITFAITDDGCGFDSTTTRRGAGLTNMEDRLDALGGALAISSTPGKGTTITGSLTASPAVPAQRA
jgi:signal transduction histidine kinase